MTAASWLAVPQALRDSIAYARRSYYMLMLDRVRQHDEFDILHFHISQFVFPFVPSRAR